MFGLTAVPSLLFLLGMFFVPESPRWLAKNGKIEKAKVVLEKIGGAAYANAAVVEINSTLSKEEIQQVRFADLLQPKLRKVLALGVVLAVFQQWCGINVIFNYAEEIFKAAGYDISIVLSNIAWTGSRFWEARGFRTASAARYVNRNPTKSRSRVDSPGTTPKRIRPSSAITRALSRYL